MRVTTLLFLAQAIWLLGNAEQAQQRSQAALARVQQVGHTPMLAWGQLYTAIFSQYRRGVAATQAYAETLMTWLSTDRGLQLVYRRL